MDAEGQAQQAQVRIEAAEVRLRRAEQLRKEGAGAQRGYDEAVAELALAQSAWSAAHERVNGIVRLLTGLDSSETGALPIASPVDGVVRAVHVVDGQVVPAGSFLFRVESLETVWVRVPVPGAALQQLDAVRQIQISALSNEKQPLPARAKRVLVPGVGNALSSTVDLQACRTLSWIRPSFGRPPSSSARSPTFRRHCCGAACWSSS